MVRNDLHAVIQYRLLESAVEIHSTPSMFRTADQFPAPESVDLPLSPYARDFYKTGSPFLLRHLPFWLAVLLEQPLVWLIPLLVILLRLFRLAPTLYDWAERRNPHGTTCLSGEKAYIGIGSRKWRMIWNMNDGRPPAIGTRDEARFIRL